MLKEKLIKEAYFQLASDNMHTHHQLFHTWIDLGIVGVILILMILGTSFFLFYKRKNKLAFWLVPLIFLNLLTDDMLEVQAGIVFFMFFLVLFFYPKELGLKAFL